MKLKIIMILAFLMPIQVMADSSETLISAVKGNNVQLLKSLLISGNGANESDQNDVTALIWASFYGNTKAVEVLLENGANPNLRVENINLLLSKNIKYRDHALSVASRTGNSETVKLLLQHANVNMKGSMGRTALHEAILNGRYDIANLLIQSGMELNTKDNSGNTALIDAVLQGNTKIVELLIKSGAELNSLNKEGKNAAMIADVHNYTTISELLDNYGGRVKSSIISKIALISAILLIVFILALEALDKIFVSRSNDIYKNIFNAVLALSFAIFVASMLWSSSQAIDSIGYSILASFEGLIGEFISLFVLVITGLLFWKKLKLKSRLDI